MQSKASIITKAKVLFFIIISNILVSCNDIIDENYSVVTRDYALKISLDDRLDLNVKSNSMENAVRDACFMIFDDNGELESIRRFEVCPNSIVFENLRGGKKRLYALANVQSFFDLSAVSIIEDIEQLNLNSSILSSALESIPMTHISEFSIPLSDPNITIGMTRQVARLSLVNDIVDDGFVVDSVVFSGLTTQSNVWTSLLQNAQDNSMTIRYEKGAYAKPLFILPTNSQQVSYTVYGKTSHGVTMRYDGVIKPQLGKNNSYSLRLKTGQLTEDGTPSSIRIDIDPLVGRYSQTDSTLYLNVDRGQFKIIGSSYDDMGLSLSADWMSNTPLSRANMADRSFAVAFDSYATSDDVREGYIRIFNLFDHSKSKIVKVKQQGENRGPKYYVIVVAGQSNASGVDRSPCLSLYDEPDPRVFELGQMGITPPYYSKFRADSSSLRVVPLYYAAQSFDSPLKKYHHKSINLSLGKQLLPHIPKDYNVLVVSVSFSGSGFEVLDGIGAYDNSTMRTVNFPSGLQGRYKMVAGSGFLFNSLVDRTLYALSLNKRNKFIGVVWSQGEVDANLQYSDPAIAYPKFEEFAQAYFDKLNKANVSEQLPRGYADKHIWYPIDCVPLRKDWHRTINNWQYATGHLFGGYKVWNPDTYVNLPLSAKMNDPSFNDDGHFGQNAFPETVVPLIIEKIKYNGIIGNASRSAKSLYSRSITLSEAKSLSGSVNDADIQNKLLVYLPFDEDGQITKNEANQTISITNNGMSLANATALKDINGNNWNRKVLQLSSKGGKSISITIPNKSGIDSWSMSFMLRRQNAKNNFSDGYLLRVPNSKRGLFYHRYGIESEGGYLGLSFQPSKNTFDRYYSVTARLNDANFVASHDEWIHYAVTYDHVSRVCTLYMNGEMTMQKTLNASSDQQTIEALKINDEVMGVDAQMYDLYIWNRQVPESTLFKVYIMSYYGIHK